MQKTTLDQPNLPNTVIHFSANKTKEIFIIMASFMSGQGEWNSSLWLATRAGKILPAWDYALCPAGKIPQKTIK